MPFAMRALFPVVQRVRALREVAFTTVSQIGIHYRKSRISQEDKASSFPHHAPKPGDRVPYMPTSATSVGTDQFVQGVRFHLVLFSGTGLPAEAQQRIQMLQKSYPDLIEYNEVQRNDATERLYIRFGIQEQGYYCIRPDEYIAYRSASLALDHFQEYFLVGLLESSPDNKVMLA
jgi:hypothetical protein